jgi:hypothetical protein
LSKQNLKNTDDEEEAPPTEIKQTQKPKKIKFIGC